MSRIDTRQWKAFPLVELFDMSNTKSIVQKDIIPDSGTIPYVTASEKNNGVLTYISCVPEWMERGECIMIGGKTLTFTYQESDFCSNDSHNIALYAKHESYVNQRIYLFLIVALRAALYQKYSWGDSISMKRIIVDEVYLPVTASGQPDLDYMDSYMQHVMNEATASLAKLALADDTKTMVDIHEWADFKIGELFEVTKGTRLTKAQMRPGGIRFIGSSAMRNGWTTSIANDEHLHPANTLTVCYNGSVGETFYQDEQFWASDDVNVLYPKFSMTENIGLFIAPLIRSIGQRYAFVDKWRMEIMRNDVIKLPVTSSCQPDWDYMDSYMASVFSDSEEALRHLTSTLSR
jgi:putative S-cspCI